MQGQLIHSRMMSIPSAQCGDLQLRRFIIHANQDIRDPIYKMSMEEARCGAVFQTMKHQCS